MLVWVFLYIYICTTLAYYILNPIFQLPSIGGRIGTQTWGQEKGLIRVVIDSHTSINFLTREKQPWSIYQSINLSIYQSINLLTCVSLEKTRIWCSRSRQINSFTLFSTPNNSKNSATTSSEQQQPRGKSSVEQHRLQGLRSISCQNLFLIHLIANALITDQQIF